MTLIRCGEIVGIGLLIHQVRNRKGIFKDENVVVEEFVIIKRENVRVLKVLVVVNARTSIFRI